MFAWQRNAIIIAPPVRNFLKKLAEQIESPDCGLSAIVIDLCRVHLDQLSVLTDKVVAIERRLKEEAKSDPETVRLQTAPGIGPVSAMTIKTFSPPLEAGKYWARHQTLSGQWMGQRDIRRMLIIGAMTRVKWAIKNGPPKGSWLEQMLERKPRMLLAIALANKTARTIWVMMTKYENYRDPIAAV